METAQQRINEARRLEKEGMLSEAASLLKQGLDKKEYAEEIGRLSRQLGLLQLIMGDFDAAAQSLYTAFQHIHKVEVPGAVARQICLQKLTIACGKADLTQLCSDAHKEFVEYLEKERTRNGHLQYPKILKETLISHGKILRKLGHEAEAGRSEVRASQIKADTSKATKFF